MGAFRRLMEGPVADYQWPTPTLQTDFSVATPVPSISDRYRTRMMNGVYVSGLPVGYLSRESVSGYSPLRRVVTLISGAGARILTNGMLRIVTSVGNRRVKPTGIEHRILEQLAETTDEGESTSRMVFEDGFADYCLDGNALYETNPSISGLTGIKRLRVQGAYVDRVRTGTVYVTFDDNGRRQITSSQNVIHARWPDVEGRFNQRTTFVTRTDGFAESPVRALHIPLALAMLSQGKLIGFLSEDNPRMGLEVDKDMAANFNPDQMKEMAEATRDRWNELNGIMTAFGGKLEPIVIDPKQVMPNELREFQLRDCARIYGVPPLLIGEHADRLPGTMAEENRISVL